MKVKIHLTNAEALEAINGDPAARNHLADAAGYQLVCYFKQHGLQESDAEDLAQVVLERTFAKLAKKEFTPPAEEPAASLMAWFRSFGWWVMHEFWEYNQRAGAMREQVAWRMRQQHEEAWRMQPLYDELPTAEDEADDPVVQQLKAAMKELSAADRQILTARHLWGMKDGEIAEKMELSSDVVRKRLSRARQRLRALLEKKCPAAAPHDRCGTVGQCTEITQKLNPIPGCSPCLNSTLPHPTPYP